MTSDAMTDCYGDRDDFTIKAVANDNYYDINDNGEVTAEDEPEQGDCEEVEDDE